MTRSSKVHSFYRPQTFQSAIRMGALVALGLIFAETLTGCLVAGYSSTGGFFLWPGSIGLVVVLLLLFLLLRRGR